MIDYIKLLNQEQHKVVTEADGPALVLAGAGSGKTRTLVFRVAYLIEKGVDPENILLVTFTNKAAKEMMDRVERLLGFKPEHLWGGTFHRVGNLILRKYAHKLGYNRNFSILDQDDSVSLIKAVMADLNLNVKGQNFPKANIVHKIISFSRNRYEDPKTVAEDVYGYPEFIAEQMDKIYNGYQERKLKANVMDFDDLLINWLKLLTDFSEVKERYSKQFKYILVDEYQDTNFIQAEIIRYLSSFNNNLLVVGDDSQSIYSFRAADVKNILDFPKKHKDTKIFRIERNYRSSPQILSLANSSIRNNVEQFDKVLFPDRPDNVLPTLIAARDVHNQANHIVKRIMELYREGKDYSTMAVLYRANYQSAEVQLTLSKYNIPYVVRGGMRYFEQAHVKDVLSYLKVLSNFSDEIAWKRILLMHEGIGEKKADTIWKTVSHYSSVAELIDSKIKLTGKASESWQKIASTFFSIEKINSSQKGFVSEVIEYVVEHGYENHMKNTFDNYRDRLEDLQQLMNFTALYDNLDQLLADVLLSETFDNKESTDKKAVVLSTIHQAKGLEWATVFIIGLKDGDFPHHKCMENPKEIEEERRLFYVAVTRAKDELNMLYPIRTFSYKFGEMHNSPSMFIKEIDDTKYSVKSNKYQDQAYDEEDTIYYD
ncbi:UvrD-helicase domain-containing protein [Candidatus Falkowbacteria bacterium]|nr:UvrD-helicase domain-containing protein [Candidatus Falkowbacteria bacterium]